MPTDDAAPGPAGARSRQGPASFHVLAKPTGAICNLDCDGAASQRSTG